jgi:hypothetical protein
MQSNSVNNFKSPKKIYHSNNVNDYFIQIDYFDKTGSKKYNNNIPLKHVFNRKTLNIFESNLIK